MTTLARATASRINGALSSGPKTAAGKAVVARNAVKHGIFAAVPVVSGECAQTWEAHRVGVLDSLQPSGALEVNLAERVALTLWRLQRLSRYEAAAIGTAVDDAGLPPPEADPFAGAMNLTAVNREEYLKWMRNEYRSASESFTAFTEAVELVRGFGSGDSPLSGELVELILGWASGLVYERPLRKFDPEPLCNPTFLAFLGLPPGSVRRASWTGDLFLRALAHHADAIGQPVDTFRSELADVLDERAAAFARDAQRLHGDITGCRRRQETWRERAAADALLPPLDVLERVSKYEKHLHNTLTSTLHELERLQARRGGAFVPPPTVADVQVTVTHEHG